MKKLLCLLVAVFSINTFATKQDCVVEVENKYCVQVNWTEGPHLDAYSTNEVIFTDLNSGEVVELPLSAQFKTWMIMDMHSHGGSAVTTTQVETGTYLNEEIYFFTGMSGVWQFRLVYNGAEYVLLDMDI
jgi:hypothetical protein